MHPWPVKGNVWRSPGKVNYGSPGQGGVHHLASEMLKQATGVDMTHAPYKGGATAYIAMLGGEIDAMFGALEGLRREGRPEVPGIEAGGARVPVDPDGERFAGFKPVAAPAPSSTRPPGTTAAPGDPLPRPGVFR